VVCPASNRVPRVPLYSGVSLRFSKFRIQGCHLLWPTFPCRSTTSLTLVCKSFNPSQLVHWFGLFPFRSPLLRESFLFLKLLRCFSSLRSRLTTMYSLLNTVVSTHSGFPHSDILGYFTCTQFPETFRSVPRPSSAFGAKASSVRS
jgi:hypothetical protein